MEAELHYLKIQILLLKRSLKIPEGTRDSKTLLPLLEDIKTRAERISESLERLETQVGRANGKES